MKITPDVNSAGLRPGGSVLPRSNSDTRSINVSDAKVSHDVIVKMQRKKSLIDGLAIAQSSRELVQKALNISSRLMSIASEAMATGRVNMDELSSQISSMNTSMGSYGETVSVAVEGSPVPLDEVKAKLDESFVRLKEKAAEMISGKPVEAKELEPIRVNLTGVASKIDVKINGYSAELGSAKKIESFNFDYPGLNKNTADLLMSNPVPALETQGNISYDMAGKLMMA